MPQKELNPGREDARKKLEEPFEQHRSLPSSGDADSPYAKPEDLKRDIDGRKVLGEEERAVSPNNPDTPISQQERRGDIHSISKSKSPEMPSSGGWKTNFRGKSTKSKLLSRYGVLGVLLTVGATFGAFTGIFNFLSSFGLDNLMSNISDKAFMRLAQVGERRSLAFMKAYMTIRMGEIEGTDGRQNVFFRAESLQGTPMLEMYRHLRGSNFEKKMAEKGYVWTATLQQVDSNLVQPRPTRVNVNNREFLRRVSLDDLEKLQSGSPAQVQEVLNKYQDWVDTEIFDSDAEANRRLRTDTRDVTSFWSFFERKTIRKVISSSIGLRKWSFFDKSSDRQQERAESRANLRNKMLAKMLPSSENGGSFSNWIRCSVNLPDCERTKEGSKKIEQGIKALKTANAAVTAFMLAELASSIDSALENGSLSQMIALARGDQAMELFATMSIAADQPRTGELNAEEMSDLMETLGDYTNGEGYQSVVTQDVAAVPKDSLPNTKQREEYCSTENQDKINSGDAEAREQFVMLCDDTRIGGKSTAKSIENWYNNNLGRVLGPILDIYNFTRNIPGLEQLGDAIMKLAEYAGAATEAALKAGLKTVGLDDNAEDLMSLIGQKVMSFLGANPILDENSPDGEISNWALQGGAQTAEVTARNRGASATNLSDEVFYRDLVKKEAEERIADRPSFFDKYISLENNESTATKILLSLNNNVASYGVGGIPGFISRTIASAPQQLLNSFNRVGAAKNPYNPYGASNFSGIDTYDFPQACYNYNVLTATPQNGTNIQEILGADNVPSEDLTWGLVIKSQDWYNYIDEKIGDREDKAEIASKIYNCNLLDSSVRSATAGIFGYSEDDDMPEGEVAEDQASLLSGDDQELAKQILDSGKVTGSSQYMSQIQAYANGNNSCNINSTILQLVASMVSQGNSMYITSLNRQCTGTLTASGTASYHYADGGGHAVDFGTVNGELVTETTWANGGSKTMKFAKDIAQLLPSGSGIGQVDCRGAGKLNLPNGVTEFTDACNHIHIQVPIQ